MKHNRPKAVYVHVPFCEQICHYCDFNKFFLDKQPINEYLQLCDVEMKNTIEACPPEMISSIYVGGGTPTSLSTAQLGKLLLSIQKYFPLADPYEWTVEVNPGSVDREKLLMMREIGVNRLSIGVQSFDPELLQKIGRDHLPEDIERTINSARKTGFNNISIDLMFGLPGQTLEQFSETLKKAVNLEIDHISAYSLKIEAKTVFYQLWQKGKLSLPGEDLEATMYEKLRSYLLEHGFTHYEISNFAIPGYESQHNLIYWTNEFYYGIGAGAHSYTDGVRRVNHGPLPKYMKSVKETGFPYRDEHHVSRKEQMEEEMFMGLRKLSGVSYKDFSNKYAVNITDTFPNVIEDLSKKGLIKDDGYRISLTEKGLLLGNVVFEQFLLG